jgi:alanine dehydrogenase
MLVGVPKEIKTHEYRVGLVPSSVRELVHHGHDVMIETNAGSGIGLSDEDYRAAGARIAPDAAAVFAEAEMVVKVKEPQPAEIAMLREGQVLFTYLHLAADKALTQGMVDSGCTGIAYETVTGAGGGLPLLAPMSEVAGRMSVQAGARCLGGGVAGTNAARMAMGMEARVTVIDKSLRRLAELDTQYGSTLNTIFATVDAIEKHVLNSDLVIGAVLVPGAAAPKLVTREMVKEMRSGAVLVDISIDQGGCFETSKPTTHDKPTYVVDGVVHYCVANMPGGVARTSTFALNNATLPFTMALADKGWRRALTDDVHLRHGLNVHAGQVTYDAVARDLGYKLVTAEAVLGL